MRTHLLFRLSIVRGCAMRVLRSLTDRGRIASIVAIVLSLCTLASGCASPPRLPSPNEIPVSTIPRLQDADGYISEQKSQAILHALSKQAGASEVLLRHVALEDVVTESPLVLGNKVRLLRDGPATYRTMYQAIRAAKRHINLETYIFEDDAVGRQLIKLLVSRQRHGVQVNVIYDSVGSAHTPSHFFEPLKAAGGRVLEFNPVNPMKAHGQWVLDHRDHRKLLIIDGQSVFTGGI